MCVVTVPKMWNRRPIQDYYLIESMLIGSHNKAVSPSNLGIMLMQMGRSLVATTSVVVMS
jgi:hypothetical protein